MLRYGNISTYAALLGLACVEAPEGSAMSAEGSLCPEAIRLLEIAPAHGLVEVGDGRSTQWNFRAIGILADGAGAPVAASWAWSPAGIGAIDDQGVVSLTGESGGEARVRAGFGDGAAETTLRVRLVRSVASESGTAPDASRIAPFSDDRSRVVAEALRWTTPEDGGKLSSNASEIAFSWNASGYSSFRLRFQSEAVRIDVYTTDTTYRPSERVWRWLTESHRGTAARVDLEAVDAQSEVVHRAPNTLRTSFCQSAEVCNGVDDDCDGHIDDDCVGI